MKLHPLVSAFVLFLVVHLAAFDASAALTDQQANQQIDNAINRHYASADIDLAEKKLLDVIKSCLGSCTPTVLARAWMYVGIVRGSGRDDVKGAGEAFRAAKAADPGVQLDELFATDLVKRVFAQTAAPGGAVGDTGLTGEMRERASAPTDVSGIVCSIEVNEVQTERPIPVSCRAPAGTSRAVLAYRHESSTRWRELPMQAAGNSWVTEIPCSDTKQIGVLAYHVRALDAQGQVVDTMGDEESPDELNLVQTTDAKPPSLPNQPPPASCRPKKAPEPKGPTLGTYGDACTDTAQCQGGLTCSDGKCTADVSCETDSDCASGACIDNVCALPDECEGDDCAIESRAPGNWFGLQGGLDFAMMSGTQVCDPEADASFSCFENGDPYTGIPNTNYAGSIDGGFRASTARIMLSYERAIASAFSIEGRLGFAFNGGPESSRALGGDSSKFLPYHAEGRLKMYFSKVYRDDGSGLRGPSAFLMLGGGLAQVDPHVVVPVGDCHIDSPPPVDGEERMITLAENACRQSSNQVIELKEVDVYQRLGQGFVSGGIGVRWGFGKHLAAVANLNAQLLLPSTGFTLSPSLGVSAGF